jgi:hypothetical protein
MGGRSFPDLVVEVLRNMQISKLYRTWKEVTKNEPEGTQRIISS